MPDPKIGSVTPGSANKLADPEPRITSQRGSGEGQTQRSARKRLGEQQRKADQKSSGTAGNRVRARRHWGYVAAGVGLMLVTGVVFATVWVSGRATAPVLALAQTVHRGQELTVEDLTVAHTVADPALAVMAANKVTEVVGQRAALDLPAGSLLNPRALVSKAVPGSGHALVGLHLSPAQLPLRQLNPGDAVSIVQAGRDGEAMVADVLTVPGVVVTSGTAEDGSRKVDVTVPVSEAAAVAGWVATGRAAVYLESQEG